MKTVIPDREYLRMFGERWGYARKVMIQYNIPDHNLTYYVNNSIPSLDSICNGSDSPTMVVRAEQRFVHNTTLGACILAIFEDHYPRNTIDILKENALSLPSFDMVNQLYKSRYGAYIPTDLHPRITTSVDRDTFIGHEYLIYKCHGKYYIFKTEENNNGDVKELDKLTLNSYVLPY